MKKILVAVSAVIIMASFVSCGGKTSSDSGSPAVNNVSDNADSHGNSANSAENSVTSGGTPVTDGSKTGVLQKVSEQEDFIIKGMYINSGSGQHEYAEVSGDKFSASALNSEYELNEWIQFYVDTDYANPSVDIYFVKNDLNADYASMTPQDIENISTEDNFPVIKDAVPDSGDNGFLGSAYINPDSAKAGKYNVFFAVKDKVCYMVQLDIVDPAN